MLFIYMAQWAIVFSVLFVKQMDLFAAPTSALNFISNSIRPLATPGISLMMNALPSFNFAPVGHPWYIALDSSPVTSTWEFTARPALEPVKPSTAHLTAGLITDLALPFSHLDSTPTITAPHLPPFKGSVRKIAALPVASKYPVRLGYIEPGPLTFAPSWSSEDIDVALRVTFAIVTALAIGCLVIEFLDPNMPSDPHCTLVDTDRHVQNLCDYDALKRTRESVAAMVSMTPFTYPLTGQETSEAVVGESTLFDNIPRNCAQSLASEEELIVATHTIASKDKVALAVPYNSTFVYTPGVSVSYPKPVCLPTEVMTHTSATKDALSNDSTTRPQEFTQAYNPLPEPFSASDTPAQQCDVIGTGAIDNFQSAESLSAPITESRMIPTSCPDPSPEYDCGVSAPSGFLRAADSLTLCRYSRSLLQERREIASVDLVHGSIEKDGVTPQVQRLQFLVEFIGSAPVGMLSTMPNTCDPLPLFNECWGAASSGDMHVNITELSTRDSPESTPEVDNLDMDLTEALFHPLGNGHFDTIPCNTSIDVDSEEALVLDNGDIPSDDGCAFVPFIIANTTLGSFQGLEQLVSDSSLSADATGANCSFPALGSLDVCPLPASSLDAQHTSSHVNTCITEGNELKPHLIPLPADVGNGIAEGHAGDPSASPEGMFFEVCDYRVFEANVTIGFTSEVDGTLPFSPSMSDLNALPSRSPSAQTHEIAEIRHHDPALALLTPLPHCDDSELANESVMLSKSKVVGNGVASETSIRPCPSTPRRRMTLVISTLAPITPQGAEPPTPALTPVFQAMLDMFEVLRAPLSPCGVYTPPRSVSSSPCESPEYLQEYPIIPHLSENMIWNPEYLRRYGLGPTGEIRPNASFSLEVTTLTEPILCTSSTADLPNPRQQVPTYPPPSSTRFLFNSQEQSHISYPPSPTPASKTLLNIQKQYHSSPPPSPTPDVFDIEKRCVQSLTPGIFDIEERTVDSLIPHGFDFEAPSVLSNSPPTSPSPSAEHLGELELSQESNRVLFNVEDPDVSLDFTVDMSCLNLEQPRLLDETFEDIYCTSLDFDCGLPFEDDMYHVCFLDCPQHRALADRLCDVAIEVALECACSQSGQDRLLDQTPEENSDLDLDFECGLAFEDDMRHECSHKCKPPGAKQSLLSKIYGLGLDVPLELFCRTSFKEMNLDEAADLKFGNLSGVDCDVKISSTVCTQPSAITGMSIEGSRQDCLLESDVSRNHFPDLSSTSLRQFPASNSVGPFDFDTLNSPQHSGPCQSAAFVREETPALMADVSNVRPSVSPSPRHHTMYSSHLSTPTVFIDSSPPRSSSRLPDNYYWYSPVKPHEGPQYGWPGVLDKNAARPHFHSRQHEQPELWPYAGHEHHLGDAGERERIPLRPVNL